MPLLVHIYLVFCFVLVFFKVTQKSLLSYVLGSWKASIDIYKVIVKLLNYFRNSLISMKSS